MTDPATRMLDLMGQFVKRDRLRFWDEHDYFVRQGRRQGLTEAAIFFRTRGCRHDAKGGCTMCDYSIGPQTSADQMADGVERALGELSSDVESVLVSPSGSMLDSWEVPLDARRRIFALMLESRVPRLAFETRAETIDAETALDCRTRLGKKPVRVYVGLESADPWVSTYAINKALDPASFCAAMGTLSDHGLSGVANILLGAPFLSEREMIDDTVATARWALTNGAAEVCLFPCHVKQWTQIYLLHAQGLYSPPSLWSMVEVLRQLGEALAPKIELAWLTSLGAFNVVASPSVCAECEDEVIARLSEFAASGRWASLAPLWAMDCPCREAWRRSIAEPTDEGRRVARAIAAFERIGTAIMPAWWAAHRDDVASSLRGGEGARA